jgi:hypothetical protein
MFTYRGLSLAAAAAAACKSSAMRYMIRETSPRLGWNFSDSFLPDEKKTASCCFVERKEVRTKRKSFLFAPCESVYRKFNKTTFKLN